MVELLIRVDIHLSVCLSVTDVLWLSFGS